MVEYALTDISSLPDPLADASVLAGIPPWRQDYILRYQRAEDRRRSLGVWRLMERMLAGRGFRAQDVAVDAGGRPYCSGIFFSLSHAGSLAMCAVSDGPVGCDVEQVRDAPFEIVPRIFGPGERAYLREVRDSIEAQRRFFTLWTLKESYMKMTGEGLGLAPERLEIRMPELVLFRDGAAQPCTLFHGAYGEYEISLCSAGKDGRFVLREPEAGSFCRFSGRTG